MFAEIYQYSDFKQRLLHFNQAFGSDPDYIFFARSVYEQQHLRSSINFVMRKWSCASLNNAISHAFGDAHISWKDFCILFSFYLKHSRKKDWKNFFDVIFLGTHTVQASPKHVWMLHWVSIYLTFVWVTFWYFRIFCALYENKPIQYQVVVTFRAEILTGKNVYRILLINRRL